MDAAGVGCDATYGVVNDKPLLLDGSIGSRGAEEIQLIDISILRISVNLGHALGVEDVSTSTQVVPLLLLCIRCGALWWHLILLLLLGYPLDWVPPLGCVPSDCRGGTGRGSGLQWYFYRVEYFCGRCTIPLHL